MAAVVAHEVRNPLAGIRGAVQVMGRRLSPGSREQIIVKEVVTGIDSLNNIVDDLLLFARPRTPTLRRVPVVGFLRETVALLAEDARFRDMTIEIDSPDVMIVGDPDQLKLVLRNLLINSAQAVDGGGEIRIVVRIAEGWSDIRIVDQGPGIPSPLRTWCSIRSSQRGIAARASGCRRRGTSSKRTADCSSWSARRRAARSRWSGCPRPRSSRASGGCPTNCLRRRRTSARHSGDRPLGPARLRSRFSEPSRRALAAASAFAAHLGQPLVAVTAIDPLLSQAGASRPAQADFSITANTICGISSAARSVTRRRRCRSRIAPSLATRLPRCSAWQPSSTPR